MRLEWQTDTPHAQHLDPTVTLAFLGTAVGPTFRHLFYVSGFYDYHEHIVLIVQTVHICMKLKISQFKPVKCDIKVKKSHSKISKMLQLH